MPLRGQLDLGRLRLRMAVIGTGGRQTSLLIIIVDATNAVQYRQLYRLVFILECLP